MTEYLAIYLKICDYIVLYIFVKYKLFAILLLNIIQLLKNIIGITLHIYSIWLTN